MKISRKQLRKLINESLEVDKEIEVTEADLVSIKNLIFTLESQNIKQAASLCDALGVDFKQLAQQSIAELVDSKWKIADDIQSDVMNQIESIVSNQLGISIFNYDLEESEFYIENETVAVDIHQGFHFGVSGSIIHYIEKYLVDMIIAIGNE
jgi:hypothetical protein